MTRPTNKRKKNDEGPGDETQVARQNKTRRTSNTVKFTDAVKTVSFGAYQQPKSILKTRSTPFPIAPGSPNTAESPSPEPSKQLEEEEVDKEAADTMSEIATAAIKMAKQAAKEQLKQDLGAAQKELAFTNNDLENLRLYQKTLEQSRDKATSALADANKRTETANAKVEEALLANGKLANKCRSLEGELNRAGGQVEKLQLELAVVRKEKAEMEGLLGDKTAKKTAEPGKLAVE